MPIKPASKTYFGIAAFISGVFCVSILLAHYGVAYMDITWETFDMLNKLTTLFYCLSTPLAFGLGVFGFTRRNDSKGFSVIGAGLVTVPFLFQFAQLVSALIQG